MSKLSVHSIYSCGRLNCNLAALSHYQASGIKKSFCELQNCTEDINEQKNVNLTQEEESCVPSNCNQFWDLCSEHYDSPQDEYKLHIIETTDSDHRILDFPECKISVCPEKRSQFILSSHKDHFVKQNLLKVQVCGNSNCCDKLCSSPGLVDFDNVCDVVTRQCTKLYEKIQIIPEKTRNKIYYCVSPSVYNDLVTLNAFNEKYNYARVEDIRKSRNRKEYCPHIRCCQKEEKTNSQLIKTSKMDQETKSTDSVVPKYSAGSEVQTYSFSFHSDLPQDEDANLLNNIPVKSASGMIKKYEKPSDIFLTITEDFPPTPMHSNLELLQGQATSVLNAFPFCPQNILSEDQIMVKKYLTTDDIAFFPAKGSLPKIIRKNQSEITALLKTVYLTTSDDFPPSPDLSNISQKDGIQTKLNKPHIDSEENVRRSSCYDKVDDLNTEKEEANLITSKENSCDPNNCDKLNFFGSRRWKNCCDNRFCPINDPTSSTYNFLLKVRMCCRTRGCQLAARICDIYEPLVQFDSKFDDVGEQQYHYLSADVSTEVCSEETLPIEIPRKETYDTVSKISDASEPEIISNVTDLYDGYETPDTYTRGNQRRTSTVSWSIPRDEEDLRTSLSQEQVIFQATAEAHKFRQTQRNSIPTHSYVFEEIVRKPIEEPSKPTKSEVSVEDIHKSQLDIVHLSDSAHKPQCCPLLRGKFLRKKKIVLEENLKWGIHGQEKRKTLGNIQVQERSVEINHILNKM